MKNLLYMFLSALIIISACKKKDKDDDDNNNNNNNNHTTSCNDTVAPVVFLHGTLASGDTYGNMVMRFTGNNYCGNRLFVFDYNGANFGGALDTAGLDDFIDEVLQKTNATQVNLAGHSLGGSFGYQYLNNAAHAAKVKHYVHIGSGAQSQPAGPNGEVATMNIYSTDDAVVTGADIPGAANVQLTGKDHYEVATCAEAFEAMYKFFNNNQSPSTTQITQMNEINISGRVVTLGENTPKPASTIKIFEVNANTGERLSGTPNFTPSVNDKGNWGPVKVSSGKYYEFEVNTNEGGDRRVYYYREPFIHDNPLVYLRTLPTSGLASILLSGLPQNDNQSVLVTFTSNQATINGRDSLIVDGNVLSTPQFCSASSTTIAMFLYDDGDNTTELTAHSSFGILPFFLKGVDMFFSTATPQPIQCRFNGRNLFVRNWKSGTEGVSIAVFD
jgi:hypothetical protein